MKQIFNCFLLLFMLNFNTVISQDKLTENQKLFTTAKVWGFLKYYHPNVAAGKFDWDNQLFQILMKIEKVDSKEELSMVYLNWIESLGDIKSCKKCAENSKEEYFHKNFDLSWIKNDTFFLSDLSKKLKYIEDNRFLNEQNYVAKAGPAGHVEPENEKIYNDFNWANKELRLLSLFRYWNFAEYYFPYKYQADQEWDSVLKEMIPEFLFPKTELEYHLSMLKLVAKLDDSHAGLTTPILDDFFGQKFIPVDCKIIDNEAVVTAIFNDSLAKMNNLRIGDVITKVSGKKIIDVLGEKLQYLRGSNSIAKRAYAWNKIFNGSTDSVEIEYYRGSDVIVKKIGRYSFEDFQYKRAEEQSWKKIDDQIGYVNLGAFTRNDLSDMKHSLMNTKGIIFDIRNYPKDFIFESFGFLFPSKETSSFKSIVPDLTYPGKFVWRDGQKFRNGGGKKYNGKVIILVNDRTISLAEFTAMYLQEIENSITIGSTTLAADGNVSSLEFVGGYKTGLTGTGIFYPDGTETQRKGVKIDIEVNPTIQGIKEGRDEVLERAIEIIFR